MSKVWVGFGWGVVLSSLVGCGGGKSTSTSMSTPEATPAECSGGVSCDCPAGGSSITRCESDGSQVCDCACSDFVPTKPSAAFDACGGDLDGGWELTEVDTSQVAGHDVVGGCPDVQVAEATSPKLLLIVYSAQTVAARALSNNAEVARGSEQLNLQLLSSCINPKYSCEGLNLGWTQNDCGTCDKALELNGIIDEDAFLLRKSSSGFRLSHPDFRTIQEEAYDYCAKGDTLQLRNPDFGIVYTLERRYFNGNPDSCPPRSLEACEALDGCHQGSCNGSPDCGLLETQGECEDDPGCTWDPDHCAGFPSKSCSIKDYGVDPACTMSKAAP